jgi:hypothetical protein
MQNSAEENYHLTGTFTRYSSRLNDVLTLSPFCCKWYTLSHPILKLKTYSSIIKLLLIIHFHRLDGSSRDVTGIFPDPVRCEFRKVIWCMLLLCIIEWSDLFVTLIWFLSSDHFRSRRLHHRGLCLFSGLAPRALLIPFILMIPLLYASSSPSRTRSCPFGRRTVSCEPSPDVPWQKCMRDFSMFAIVFRPTLSAVIRGTFLSRPRQGRKSSGYSPFGIIRERWRVRRWEVSGRETKGFYLEVLGLQMRFSGPCYGYVM